MKKKREPSIFENLVYEATKRIGRGKVSTYALIAKEIGREKSYRAVGSALNRNPYVPKVPCHRVVSSSGKIGGYAFGAEKKIKLLNQEGIMVKDDKVLDFENRLFRF